MADGCPEQLRHLPEFVRYIVTSNGAQKAKIARLARSATCPVRRLNSDGEVAAFVEEARLLFATKDV
jgi:hypothetical protein